MERCIVLNGDYTFLNTVSWKRAVRLLMQGKTEVLKYGTDVIRSEGLEIKIPLVMRLIKIIRMIYRSKVPFSKKNVLIRDGYKCAYCNTDKDLTMDHVLPSSKGGRSNFDNCVAACKTCNGKKGDRTPSQAHMPLLRRPYSPTISEFLRIRMNQLGINKFLEEVGVF